MLKDKVIARINLILNNEIKELNVKYEYVPNRPFNLLLITRIYYNYKIG
jgi:hypothetical protein